MSYSFMKFEVTEGVALCTFDRPDAANAMHLGMMEEMFDIAVRIDEDPAIRAAVFTGTGKIASICVPSLRVSSKHNAKPIFGTKGNGCAGSSASGVRIGKI